MPQPERVVRQEAVRQAKVAVRAYVLEPSEKHAREVEEAWQRVRRIDALVRWRSPGQRYRYR